MGHALPCLALLSCRDTSLHFPFMEREVDLIIVWKDAVDAVKDDVFEGEDEVLFDEIQEIIDDGDVEDIYEAFTGMKVAAQAYLTQIQKVCPSCTE